jgi:hypothetical protein
VTFDNTELRPEFALLLSARGPRAVPRDAVARATADTVRARIGLAMNWRILQVFLAHPFVEVTRQGLERLGCTGYPREALGWGLRALERGGFLRSRRLARGQRCYWLTDDPAVRAELQLCLAVYS